MSEEEFKAVEMRVAAFTDLTASEGRVLYAAYVKRGLELQECRAREAVLREALGKAAEKLKYYFPSCRDSIVAELDRILGEGR